MAKDTLSIGIAVDASAAVKGFREVDKEAAAMAKKLQSTQTKLKDGIGKAGLAVAAGTAFMLKGAIGAAQESQKIAKVTESVVKSTGGAANLSAKQVGDLATNLSNLTGIDDELIQSSENVLLTFTKVRNEVGKGNDIFSQAAGLALDMSTVLGGDASSAAMQLGKALNDPIKGISALSRSGVSFTAQQKEQVKALVATGDTLGAQKIILKEVATEFGGAAAAQATNADKARVAFGNMQESVGGAFLPAMESAAKVAAALATAVGALPKPVQAGAGALAIVGGSALYLVPKVKGAVEQISLLAAASPRAAAALKGLGVAGLAAGAGFAAFTVTKSALDSLVDFEGNTSQLAEDLQLVGKGGLSASEGISEMGYDIKGLVGDIADIEAHDGQWFPGTDEASNRLRALDDSLANLVETGHQKDADKAYLEISNAFVKAGGNANDLGQYMTAYADATGHATRVTRAKSKALKDDKKATDDGTKATKESNQAYKDWRDGVQGAMDAFTKFTDKKAAALDANIAFEQAIDDETQSLKENGTTLDIHTDKGRANIKAAQDARQAIRDQAQALIDNGGSAKDAAALIRDHTAKLGEQERAAGLSGDKVHVLNYTMGLTPEQVDTEFRTPGLASALAQAQALNLTIGNLIANPKVIQVGVSYANAVGVGGVETLLGKDVNGNGVIGRASGGTTWGGLTRVGERGPELVRLPKGSQVYSNTRSRQMVGAGAPTVVVPDLHVYIDGQQVEATVRRRAQDREARTGKAWTA